MMRRRFGWGPAAFVVSMLALILSLGGTGYALTTQGQVAAKLPGWHNLSLTGGWRYGGFDSYHAGYFKDSGSVVHLRGSAAGGSESNMAFRLPKGDRPSHTLWLSTYAFDGTSGGLEIQPGGQAHFFDAGTGDASKYSSLDGISFRVP